MDERFIRAYGIARGVFGDRKFVPLWFVVRVYEHLVLGDL